MSSRTQDRSYGLISMSVEMQRGNQSVCLAVRCVSVEAKSLQLTAQERRRTGNQVVKTVRWKAKGEESGISRKPKRVWKKPIGSENKTCDARQGKKQKQKQVTV